MARVTIEDCVKLFSNRFLLVQAAVRRTRQLMEGSKPMVQAKNREAVVALREIAAEKVRPAIDMSGTALPEPAHHEMEEDAALLESAIEEVSGAQMVSAAFEDESEDAEKTSGEEETAEPQSAEVEQD